MCTVCVCMYVHRCYTYVGIISMVCGWVVYSQVPRPFPSIKKKSGGMVWANGLLLGLAQEFHSVQIIR